MAYPIPSPLVTTCAHHPAWQAWLDALPALLETLAARWELTLAAPFTDENLRFSWVAPATRADGTPAVLKVGIPHFEAEHEADGLRFWANEGAAWVYAVDTAHHALLLERCAPGTPLRTLPEPEQDLVLARVLPRLWRAPVAPHPFRPLSEMLRLWAGETRADEARWSDPGLVRAGLTLFETLSQPSADDVLLATDLHAGNVLRAQREPWLVIDPKPFVGDRHYDATQHLLHNCEERLRADPDGVTRRLADLLDLDDARLRLWLFARAAAESRSDWSDLSLARLLAP